jgi:hypothetical protein
LGTAPASGNFGERRGAGPPVKTQPARFRRRQKHCIRALERLRGLLLNLGLSGMDS